MKTQKNVEVLALTDRLCEHAHEVYSSLKPTDFYNEGWLAALTLSVTVSGVSVPLFYVAPEAR